MHNIHAWKAVHLIGIGGINMSAVAKLLVRAGVRVSGSDLHASDETNRLEALGVTVHIGAHDERHVPEACDGIIHTSAVPPTNPELVAAAHRNIPAITNFAWMGGWFRDKQVVLVTGTHGKSTTTALLGAMLIAAGKDPTVIVGSLVPDWPDGNLRIGATDLVVIEGDEYAKHFLEFHPSAVILNNIELDHTDVYADIDDVRKTFERLLHQAKRDAVVVANADDPQVALAVKPLLTSHLIRVVHFEEKDAAPFPSPLIGRFNRMNIAAAAKMAHELGASDEAIASAVRDFKGIWRRMELIGYATAPSDTGYRLKDTGSIQESGDLGLRTKDLGLGIPVYSDYGHHPTAVKETLAGVREAFPDKRIVLCFQPHHKNRTRHLFDEFVSCFDGADVLVLCEIYDVPGRSAPEDAETTSMKLREALQLRITNSKLRMTAEYAPNPEAAVRQTLALLKPGDVCIFMGAGDIDAKVRKSLKSSQESIRVFRK